MILQEIGDELETLHLVYGDVVLEPVQEDDQIEMPEEERKKLMTWLTQMDDKLIDAPECQLNNSGYQRSNSRLTRARSPSIDFGESRVQGDNESSINVSTNLYDRLRHVRSGSRSNVRYMDSEQSESTISIK